MELQMGEGKGAKDDYRWTLERERGNHQSEHHISPERLSLTNTKMQPMVGPIGAMEGRMGKG